MAINYASAIPVDKNLNPLQTLPPPIVAKVTTGAAPPATSSVVTFGANTTVIEVTALNASLAIKWGCVNNNPSVIATAGTANYDHIVPVNTTRRFVIPVSVVGATSSVVGAGALNGLYTTMAVIATGSVITGITEY